MAKPGRMLTVATTMICLVPAALAADAPATTTANPSPGAVLVLGAAGLKHNAHGTLTANAEGFTFESKGHSTTKVPSAELEKVTVGSGQRESGGTPVTVAKLAVPYGGGRVVSLFAHEKYDTLTIEYRDENHAFHGLVFNLPKGQADPMQAAIGQLAAKTAAAPTSTASEHSDATGWAIQVVPVNPGDTAISQAFLVATYEYLIEQLEQSHKYVAVLRDGDANAAKYGKLLILTTDVQKFVGGNEEARAVTTVKGWTKLGVKMHLATSDGHAVLDKDVESNVRFYGNNLRATQTLAHSMVTLASTATVPK